VRPRDVVIAHVPSPPRGEPRRRRPS
jgi:hypothetical protein